MDQQRLPDFMALYSTWDQLANGPKAELRRVARPNELLEAPAFYRLYSGRAHSEWQKLAYQRLIFCLPHITHAPDGPGLGKALAKDSRVSEKRLFQVIRSDTPNDMIQLRRIVQMAKPAVSWPMVARTLWYWNDRSKRDLLEDYFINLPK